MKNISYLFFLAFLLFSSCASGQKENGTHKDPDTTTVFKEEYDYLSQLEKDIVGEWINVAMKVNVKTYNNTDTSFIVDINEDSWNMKMNIKPIITKIYDDGTYTSEFRNSYDSLMYNPKGTWFIDGDTLVMEDHQATYKYQIFIDGDMSEFKSMIDWDKDGDMDDEYFGKQQKKK